MKFLKICCRMSVLCAALYLTSTGLRAQSQTNQLPSQQPVGQQPLGQQPVGQQAQPQSGQPQQAAPGQRGSTPSGAAAVNAFATAGGVISAPAAIKCIHDIDLAAQADGILQELLFEEGAAVEKGQLVFTIDERTALAELAVAKKEAEAAAAQAAQDANVQFSKKTSEVSDAEYLESKELYERNAASLSETRRKQLEAQKARWGIKVAEVDHQKDILSSHVANEKVAAAQVQLELRKVISPYDGIIVERLRDQGEWVKAGEPILRLVHLKEMRVEVNVPVQGASAAMLQNARIRVHVNINGDDVTFDSTIEYVSPVIELNTCRIWARVPNQMIAGGWMLRDGMEATVDIQLPQPVAAQSR